MDVVVVGSCNTDLSFYTSQLPKEGETITGYKFAPGFGGKGANQCITASKLGAKVAMVGKVGDDVFGQEYFQHMKNSNVHCDYLQMVQGASTGVAAINVADNGSNCIIIVPGVNDLITDEDVKEAEALISSSKILVCQNEILPATTLFAVQLASKKKVKIIYNPAPAKNDLHPDLFSLPDIFCVNETEAEIVSGCPVQSVEDAKAVCTNLIKTKRCNCVIVTLGEKGVVYQESAEAEPSHVAITPVKAVDTTGAGDSFIGSLAFFLSTRPDLPLREAIKRSSDIATLSVQKPGTQSSYPTAKELPPEILS